MNRVWELKNIDSNNKNLSFDSNIMDNKIGPIFNVQAVEPRGNYKREKTRDVYVLLVIRTFGHFASTASSCGRMYSMTSHYQRRK